MEGNDLALTRARLSRAAIERLYIEMRHLFYNGTYRRLGARGEVLTEALLTLSPEIYGSMADTDKVELDGLVYVIDRLPRGIEECRFIKLISEEGYAESGFEVIVPAARRRNCYRIDEDYMYMEVTRGRSEIYDILTHLTFLYLESEKIKGHALDEHGNPRPEWLKLEAIVRGDLRLDDKNRDVAFSYLSSLLGRSFAATRYAYERLARQPDKNNGLFHVVYSLGRIAIEATYGEKEREIAFSPTLRDRIGHHIYGERWAESIKQHLADRQLLDRPLHIISANPHSVLNTLCAWPALHRSLDKNISVEDLALELSKPENGEMRETVREYARRHGMDLIDDPSGTNIPVQIFDTSLLEPGKLHPQLSVDIQYLKEERPVILVMDYAFGEQAYETMDELLKPYKNAEQAYPMQVASISIMGKAGILEGDKGDIMVPTSHVFEGTADNYPIDNEFTAADFSDSGVMAFEGPMITVLGTSLQNRDVLSYFKDSSWKAIGLEMEGAHYQKAIQANALIRKNIDRSVVLRYAYYASDNPLVTGSTLASGSLGIVGVKPTYFITRKILDRILQPRRIR
ncbi:MAG: hypothetical protein EAZ89_11590 [Bacteroidetes bacterium]|nr:MAG: hypothetical protein EAZ89_11590 [Bacteroidota bacterium]